MFDCPTTALIGCVHLLPLPGAPRYGGSMSAVTEAALRDAEALMGAGFHGIIVENFGDTPFYPDTVPVETVAALTCVASEVRRAHPESKLGINVLRNDGEAAVAIGTAVGANFVRINQHMGVSVAAQGWLVGRSHEICRLRARLQSDLVIVADIGVKHTAPLAHRDLIQEAFDAVERGLVDALAFSGAVTGQPPPLDEVRSVRARLGEQIDMVCGSGVTLDNAAEYSQLFDALIVGTALKLEERIRNPVSKDKARRFVELVSKSA